MRRIVALILVVLVVVPPTQVIHAAAIFVTTVEDELNLDGDCSLREAVHAANLDLAVDACSPGNGADTIVLPPGSFELTLTGSDEDGSLTGDLDLADDVTLGGAGRDKTFIDGRYQDRVIDVRPDVIAVLQSVTVQHGFAGSSSPDGGSVRNQGTLSIVRARVRGSEAAGLGGGISSTGPIAITESFVAGNRSARGGGLAVEGNTVRPAVVIVDSIVSENRSSRDGGGLWITRSSLRLSRTRVLRNRAGGRTGEGGGIKNIDGIAVLSEATVSDNLAVSNGGGISNQMNNKRSNLMVARSTISGNISGANGGGIHSLAVLALLDSTLSGNTAAGDGGGLALFQPATLANATIVENIADSDSNSSGEGGGIFVGATSVVRNTLLATNTDASGQSPACYVSAQPGVELVSQGHNLIDSLQGCALGGDMTGNLVGIANPMIGPLTDNGGNTPTHALLPGSPAIDTANPELPGTTETACRSKDQHNIPRPRDGDGDGTARCDIGSFELNP